MDEQHWKAVEQLAKQAAEIKRLRAALTFARDAWREQLNLDIEAAGDDEHSQPMLRETRKLIAKCNAALGEEAP